jgi:hypothetical protein
MKIETKAMIYSKPNWDLNNEMTRNYIESEEYKRLQKDNKKRHEIFREMDINETINIESIYFENIYDRLFEINIKKIIEEHEPKIVADGSSVVIEFGANQSFISIGVRPGSTMGEIGKVDQIIKEIFEKASLIEYY